MAENSPYNPDDWQTAYGSEFGEVDNPVYGGYTEPNWDTGKWGADLKGWDNEGIALPNGVPGQRYEVKNPVTGATVIATVKDEGPGLFTGKGIDLLPGTAQKLGFDYRGRNIGQVEFRAISDNTPSDSGDFWGFGENQPSPEAQTPREQLSPMAAMRQKWPAAYGNASDGDIISRISQFYPDIPKEKIAAYANDPNGFQALREEEASKKNPLEVFKVRHPEYQGLSNDDALKDIYHRFMNPSKISFDAFKDKMLKSGSEPSYDLVKGWVANMAASLGKAGATTYEGISSLQLTGAHQEADSMFDYLYPQQDKAQLLKDWLATPQEQRRPKLEAAVAESIKREGHLFANPQADTSSQTQFIGALNVLDKEAQTQKETAWIGQVIKDTDNAVKGALPENQAMVAQAIGQMPYWTAYSVVPGLRELTVYGNLYQSNVDAIRQSNPSMGAKELDSRARAAADAQFPAQEVLALMFRYGGGAVTSTITNRFLKTGANIALTTAAGAGAAGATQVIQNIAAKRAITDDVGGASAAGGVMGFTGGVMHEGGKLSMDALNKWLKTTPEGKTVSGYGDKVANASPAESEKVVNADPTSQTDKEVQERANDVVAAVMKEVQPEEAGGSKEGFLINLIGQYDFHMAMGDEKAAKEVIENAFANSSSKNQKSVGKNLQSILDILAKPFPDIDNDGRLKELQNYLYAREPEHIGSETSQGRTSEYVPSPRPQDDPGAALDFIRGPGETDRSEQQTGQDALGAQRKAGGNLVDWARGIGKLINWDNFLQSLTLFHQSGAGWPRGGRFHKVYQDPFRADRVVKVRTLNQKNIFDAEKQLRDYSLMNKAFGSGIEVTGVSEPDDNGKVRLITSMPIVQGDEPTMQEIAAFFGGLGWQREGRFTFKNDQLGLRAMDAHEGNLIKMADGTIVPVDLMMEEIPVRGVKPGIFPPSEKEPLSPTTGFHEALAEQAGGKLSQGTKRGEDISKKPEPEELAKGTGPGPFTAARAMSIPEHEISGAMNKDEMLAAIQHYRAKGEHAKADVIQRAYNRRFKAGEAGSAPNPARIMVDLVRDFGRVAAEQIEKEKAELRAVGKVFKLGRVAEMVKHEFNPAALGEGARAAIAYIIKERANARARTAGFANEIFRQMQVNEILRGGEDANKREDYMAKYKRSVKEEMLMQAEEGKPTGDKVFDMMAKVDKAIYAGLAALDERMGIKYERRNNYIKHLLEPADRDKFEEYIKTHMKFADPSFMKPREFDTYRQALAVRGPDGKPLFRMRWASRERLVQMRIAESFSAYAKIRVLKQLASDGWAWETKTPGEKPPIVQTWNPDVRVHTADGKNYLIDPGAKVALDNAYDPSVLDNSVYGNFIDFMKVLKGISSPIHLGTTLGHEDHLIRVRMSDRFVNLARNPRATPSDWLFAFADASTQPFPGVVGLIGDNIKYGGIVDVLTGRRGARTPEEAWQVKQLTDSGFNAHPSFERIVEWNEWLSDKMPDWFREEPAFRNGIGVAYKLLSNQYVNRWMFRKVIPAMKAASLMEKINNLYADKPELVEPGNERQRLDELQKLGMQVDIREGEMNFDNLFWKKLHKDLGIALFQSLTWQLGLMDYATGWAQDLTHNISHMDEIAEEYKKKGFGPAARKAVTDRMLYTAFMTATTAIRGAIMTYIAAAFLPPDEKKRFHLEWMDLWYPKTGLNSDGTIKRLKPLDFPTELQAYNRHMREEGMIGGNMTFWTNKANPVLSAGYQAFISKTSYYGQKIRGDNNIGWQNLAYFIEHGFGPISSQQTAPLAVKTLQGKETGKDIPPAILAFLGLNEAPHWTERSQIENDIITRHSQLVGSSRSETAEQYQAIHGFQEAIRSKDTGEIADMYETLLRMGKTEKQIDAIAKSANIPVAQKFFKTLPPADQRDLWLQMTDEEKATYAPLLRKESVNLLSGSK